jgi:hypothetical protein
LRRILRLGSAEATANALATRLAEPSLGYVPAVTLPVPAREPSLVVAEERCAACGASSEDAHGWAGYRDDELDAAESPELVFLCEGCAELEFG